MMELNKKKIICKISSALTNFDALAEENKYFTGQFKRDTTKFFDFFLHHTADITAEMWAEDSQDFKQNVYRALEEIEDCVDAHCEESKQLGLMLAKLISATENLKASEKSIHSKLFVDPLLSRLKVLTSKGYIRKLPISSEGMRILTREITLELDKTIIR